MGWGWESVVAFAKMELGELTAPQARARARPSALSAPRPSRPVYDRHVRVGTYRTADYPAAVVHIPDPRLASAAADRTLVDQAAPVVAPAVREAEPDRPCSHHLAAGPSCTRAGDLGGRMDARLAESWSVGYRLGWADACETKREEDRGELASFEGSVKRRNCGVPTRARRSWGLSRGRAGETWLSRWQSLLKKDGCGLGGGESAEENTVESTGGAKQGRGHK